MISVTFDITNLTMGGDMERKTFPFDLKLSFVVCRIFDLPMYMKLFQDKIFYCFSLELIEKRHISQ